MTNALYPSSPRIQERVAPARKIAIAFALGSLVGCSQPVQECNPQAAGLGSAAQSNLTLTQNSGGGARNTVTLGERRFTCGSSGLTAPVVVRSDAEFAALSQQNAIVEVQTADAGAHDAGGDTDAASVDAGALDGGAPDAGPTGDTGSNADAAVASTGFDWGATAIIVSCLDSNLAQQWAVTNDDVITVGVRAICQGIPPSNTLTIAQVPIATREVRVFRCDVPACNAP